ncbi:hypothetical protein LMG23992_05251 [Cupriavidus laharis]|uniref:Uncharacterized protein n=1 Tax=Cupriavidus laharis TaxID=151654 RepID=A0ABN7ZET6_9BURK|nr:hypothetical protein LMG23992_05251 [Cupriavidus laharis]
MKPVVHHFHSHPPHHGARYYALLAMALLLAGVLYVGISLLTH